MKSIKLLVATTIFLLFFAAQQASAQVSSPIILETTLLKAEYGDQIMVKGLSDKGTVVLVYINGVYYGLANISNNDPDLNNFSYLSPVITGVLNNNYTITAVSRGFHDFSLSSPTESKVSAIVQQSYFKKADRPKGEILKPNTQAGEAKEELPIPAPTLTEPIGNINTNRPTISGFSKNETIVKLYIDNLPEVEILVKNGESGIAKFKHTPTKDLPRGLHFVHAIATDLDGRKSENSNLLYFFISQPQIISTSTTVEIEQTQPQINIETIKTSQISSSSAPLSSSVTKKIIGPAFNISLFILFAIGVIVWIIITNMELKKEQSTKNEEDLTSKK